MAASANQRIAILQDELNQELLRSEILKQSYDNVREAFARQKELLESNGYAMADDIPASWEENKCYMEDQETLKMDWKQMYLKTKDELEHCKKSMAAWKDSVLVEADKKLIDLMKHHEKVQEEQANIIHQSSLEIRKVAAEKKDLQAVIEDLCKELVTMNSTEANSTNPTKPKEENDHAALRKKNFQFQQTIRSLQRDKNIEVQGLLHVIEMFTAQLCAEEEDAVKAENNFSVETGSSRYTSVKSYPSCSALDNIDTSTCGKSGSPYIVFRELARQEPQSTPIFKIREDDGISRILGPDVVSTHTRHITRTRSLSE